MMITKPGTARKHETAHADTAWDAETLRADFPALHQTVHGHPLVYLDNAATTQKPQSVIDALVKYYSQDNANVHRGVHELSVRATRDYEGARLKVQQFIGAGRLEEVVFVRSTTEAINLVAQSYGRNNLRAGDEIIISGMEHHSNIVPWQILCQQTGAILRVVPINDAGEFEFDQFEKLLSPKCKLVAVAHVSNALGTINPISAITERAHREGAVVLVDGAQAAPHVKVDVSALDCDFFTLSGHKLYGPTGIGVLYAKHAILESMPPYQGGGEMIKSVRFEKTEYNELPHRFEAGTPNIAGVIGLAAAVNYVESLGLDRVSAYEDDLLRYTTSSLADIPGVRLIGTALSKAAVVSFVIEGVHPHDAGTVLDHQGIAVRTGHHCAQPIMERFGVPATIRASLAFYNTREEIDALVRGVRRVIEVLKP